MKVLLVSGRGAIGRTSEACARDFEDVIVSAIGADLFTKSTDTATLSDTYDMAIIVSVSLDGLEKTIDEMLPAVRSRVNGPTVGYLFGAYGVLTRRNRFYAALRIGRRKSRFATLDCLYLGISDDAEEISENLAVRTRYLPMAANMAGVGAHPYETLADRPITLSAYGRQKTDHINAFCDRLNRPDSAEIVYYPNLLNTAGTNNLPRYRAMFWQILRNSRLSACYDHAFTNGENARLTYVGPRWFEALAAGTVVIGRAPDTEDRRRLLDWKDAVIDLPTDPEAATEELVALSRDDERIRAASREALVQMSLRHDWSHRLVTIFEAQGLPVPDRLRSYTTALAKRAGSMKEIVELRRVSPE